MKYTYKDEEHDIDFKTELKYTYRNIKWKWEDILLCGGIAMAMAIFLI